MYNDEKQKNIAIVIIWVIIFLIVLLSISFIDDKESNDELDISQDIEKIYDMLIKNNYNIFNTFIKP